MQTIGINELLERHTKTDEVEVLVGLADDTTPEKIEMYCGEDGTVIKHSGFGICRVRLTANCLQDLINGAERWIDFIEPAATDAKSWKTEYNKEYSDS